MSKKKKSEEEDFEEGIDGEFESDEVQNEPSDEESQDSEDPVESIVMADDADTVDIVLEISDDVEDTIVPGVDVVVDAEVEEGEEDEVILSKHKMEGKHSLKYDSIFKGKKEDKLDEEDSTSMYFNEKFEVDKSSFFYVESYDNESYTRSKSVKEKVYAVLASHTEINFLNNRRKPSKMDFNHYYGLLKTHLDKESFTNVEIFNELSVYFSDNLFNMFKLLDNKWRNSIIDELQDHIGKNTNSKEITNRNIYVGTEIEFVHEDPTGETKVYTGVVVETDYETSTFMVDSYENIYEIGIECITKILNNTKFKYNLNRLNNIDFL